MDPPPHRYFQFGPYLALVEVDANFCSELLEEGRTLRKTHSKSLAGQIENQWVYEDLSWIAPKFQPYIDSWVVGWSLFNSQKQPTVRGKLISMWINFQKAKEHQPVHIHTHCDLSFALWLKYPDEIDNEVNETTGPNPGHITFLYGEDRPLTLTERHFCPAENFLMIFPANLRHQVAAFKSDVERVSVAGNIVFENIA